MTPETVSDQAGGLYKLTYKDSHWHVLHQERDVVGHHNPNLNKVWNKTVKTKQFEAELSSIGQSRLFI